MCSFRARFVWDQSGIRITGIMQVSVRLAALPIPEYLDFHSGYSAPRSRIAGIYSRIKLKILKLQSGIDIIM